MNNMQTKSIEEFAERIWKTTEELNRITGIVVSEAIRSGDYEVDTSGSIKLAPEYILEESVHFPKVQQFRHDTHVGDGELLVWIWATDDKRDIVQDEGGERVRKQFPNRFGGVSIGSTITMVFSEDGLEEWSVYFTLTEFHTQGWDD